MGFAEGNWASVVILGGPSGREYTTRDPFDVQPGLGGDQRRCDLRLTKENPLVSRVNVGTFFWWLCRVYLKLELRKRKGPFLKLLDREGRISSESSRVALKRHPSYAVTQLVSPSLSEAHQEVGCRSNPKNTAA